MSLIGSIIFNNAIIDVSEYAQIGMPKSRRIGCVLRVVTYNAGLHNLSFDCFDGCCGVPYKYSTVNETDEYMSTSDRKILNKFV